MSQERDKTVMLGELSARAGIKCAAPALTKSKCWRSRGLFGVIARRFRPSHRRHSLSRTRTSSATISESTCLENQTHNSERHQNVSAGAAAERGNVMARKFAKACLGAGLNLVTVLFGLFVFHSALGSQLWLSRTGPWIRQTATPTDFMQLFLDDAPWTNAAANVKVFKVAAPFAIAATDEQLMRMFVSLKKHNIAFALETQMLPVGPNGCGQGVEGYMDPIGLRKLMERIQRLGAELRYLVMDEPLWFGHQSNGKNTCQSTIDEIVKNVATHVAIVKKVFPNVEIDDVEPIASPGEPNDWVAELSSFHRAYKQAVGEPLGAFEADLTSSGNWQPQLTPLAKIVHAAGMQSGIIFLGDA